MSKKPEAPKPYSPMNVLGMLKSKGVQVPVGKDFGRPTKPLLDAAGDVVKIPETCAILLLAFTNGSTMLPDDFHNVERSARGLKEYVRPDGGVFLGTFQAHGEPDGVVVVYGDPAMSQGAAQKIAMLYREGLIQKYQAHEAQQALGPFSGLTAEGVVQPAADTEARLSPAVSQQEMDASAS